MNFESGNYLKEQADNWSVALSRDPSFTESDVQELKCHLLDTAELLAEKGLNEREAFLIAASRLGDVSILKGEFEEVNTPVIQLRNTILAMSGALFFFFIYFFITSTTRLLALTLDSFCTNQILNFEIVLTYTSLYILFLLVSTIILYSSSAKTYKRIEQIKIKPKHTFLLFSCILLFALFDRWIQQIDEAEHKLWSYTSYHMYELFDYMRYILPFVTILCFTVLFFKFNRIYTRIPQNKTSPPDLHLSSKMVAEESPSNSAPLHQSIKELMDIGLSEPEAREIARFRSGKATSQRDFIDSSGNLKNSNRTLLIISSGVLAYFFLYFALFATSGILFVVLQYFENDALLNIRRTWSYVLAYHWMFILFSAGQYFLDKNLSKRIKNFHFKTIYTLWLLLTTIFLAILSKLLLPIMKNLAGTDYELKYGLMKIFLISNYTLPFTLGACFLVLFYKYYTDNVKVGRKSE